MIFLKSVFGGIIAVVGTWIIIVCAFAWRSNSATRQQDGLTAVAGGWNYLLRMPLVGMLLTVAFGIGLFVTVRWIL